MFASPDLILCPEEAQKHTDFCDSLADSHSDSRGLSVDLAWDGPPCCHYGIEKSLQRTSQAKRNQKDVSATPAELNGDEDDNWQDPFETELAMRQSYMEGRGKYLQAEFYVAT